MHHRSILQLNITFYYLVGVEVYCMKKRVYGDVFTEAPVRFHLRLGHFYPEPICISPCQILRTVWLCLTVVQYVLYSYPLK